MDAREERIGREIALIRQRYEGVARSGEWVRVEAYPLPDGWSGRSTDVAFRIPDDYPGAPPYGIYVPSGITFRGQSPNGFTDPASQQPPFGGSWAVFSWQASQWRAAADVHSGTNLLNCVEGFAVRFREGV